MNYLLRAIFYTCCSVAQLCLTLYDPMNCSTQGFPVLHHLLEFVQTCVHWVGDAIQPSHPQQQLLSHLSCVRLFVSPWTAAHQAPLSFTISRCLLRSTSIVFIMLSNHLILCCPFLLLPSIFPSIRIFSKEPALHHQVAKILVLQLQDQSFQWIFRVDFL